MMRFAAGLRQAIIPSIAPNRDVYLSGKLHFRKAESFDCDCHADFYRERPEMESDCRQKPPPGLIEGIGQFNRGEYYDCHETLEGIWRDEPGKIRDLYKGILQIGVAIYQANRSNVKGALRLLASGVELLSPFTPECMGVDVADLLQSADRFKEELIESALDRSLSPRTISIIRFIQ
jgi:hypothetical protein